MPHEATDKIQANPKRRLGTPAHYCAVTLVAVSCSPIRYGWSLKTAESQNAQPESQGRQDIREDPKRGRLPCGARYCHRCYEECGVIVNAYILRDLMDESPVDSDD